MPMLLRLELNARLLSLILIATILSANICLGVFGKANGQRRTIDFRDHKHGEQQILKLLRDRPDMAKFVNPNDSVWNWGISQFAGAETGYRIFWINKPTESGYAAENGFEEGRGTIRMQTVDDTGRHLSGEEQWTAVIYELINIRNNKKFFANWQRASQHKMSKEEWVRVNAELEYTAHVLTKRFFFDIWLPHMTKNKMKTDSRWWRVSLPDTFKEWITRRDSYRCLAYWNKVFPGN